MLLIAVQGILSFVFLFSSISKIADNIQFVRSLRSARLPKRVIDVFILAIPLGEFLIATGLVLSTSTLTSIFMMISMFLLVLFTTWMALMYRRHGDMDCGCFGRSSLINRHSILRNLGLVSLSAVGLFLSLKHQDLLWEHRISFLVVLIILAVLLTCDRNIYNFTRNMSSTNESRRQFIKTISAVLGALLIGSSTQTASAANPCVAGRRCRCYPETWREHVCQCDCANHPDSYCYGPVYDHTEYKCCEPDLPVACVMYTVYVRHEFCEYCPG